MFLLFVILLEYCLFNQNTDFLSGSYSLFLYSKRLHCSASMFFDCVVCETFSRRDYLMIVKMVMKACVHVFCEGSVIKVKVEASGQSPFTSDVRAPPCGEGKNHSPQECWM